MRIEKKANGQNRSSKSALHGLVHWLASAYAKSGITVNGVAPALIQDTAMLPGSNEELSKSTYFLSCIALVKFLSAVFMLTKIRNPNRPSRLPTRDRRDCCVDGEDGICDEQSRRC